MRGVRTLLSRGVGWLLGATGGASYGVLRLRQQAMPMQLPCGLLAGASGWSLILFHVDSVQLILYYFKYFHLCHLKFKAFVPTKRNAMILFQDCSSNAVLLLMIKPESNKAAQVQNFCGSRQRPTIMSCGVQEMEANAAWGHIGSKIGWLAYDGMFLFHALEVLCLGYA